MRAFITGATGFIGGYAARALRRDGWDVTALVRDPSRAGALSDQGIEIVRGDVTDPASFADAMKGHDAVLHIAAWYSLGAHDRAAMERINVTGTQHVLSAAADAQIPRILHCSSIAVFGTQPSGTVGDEQSLRSAPFSSVYEETKFQAHQRARALADAGAPIVIVMPGAVYGVGDTSLLGVMFGLYARRLLVALPFHNAGVSWVHVQDVADGMVRAIAQAPAGESYILGGHNETIGGLMRRIEPLTGIHRPWFNLSRSVTRLTLPLDPLIAKLLGQSPGIVRDGYRTLDGSVMFSSAKAAAAFGYAYRSIEEGIPPMIAAMHAARG
jgi:dihydroflavonol-4-reductase